jgi:Na+-driven multidrug efflux pump
MRQSVRTCLKMAFVTTIVLSGVLLLGGGLLLNMFTDDANVVTIGLSIIRLLVPTYFTYVCIEVLSGAVRGTGDTLVPTLMTLTGICLMRVLWLFFVVPHNRTLPMVLVSYPLTWALTSVLFIAYYLSNSWFKRALKRKEDRENEMVEE